MSNITLQIEGRRIYIAGNSFPIKNAIKEAGGHWDGDRKQWWIGAGKKGEIEKAITTAKPLEARAEETGENMRVIGKATYKGKTYFVAWTGSNRNGEPCAKLAFRDGSKTFWAGRGVGAGDCQITKIYQQPKTIRSINEYAAQMKSEGGRENRGFSGPTKQCWECGGLFDYMTAKQNDGDWQDSYCGC